MEPLDVASLLLRLTLGLTMAFHGYAKLFRGGRVQGLTRWFASMEMRPAKVQAWLAIAFELGGGLAFAAGLLTPLTAAAMVGLMVVAGWTSHRGKGFLITGGGWEYNVFIAGAAAGTAALGGGRWSLDRLLGIHDDLPVGWAGAGLALGLGVGVAALQLALCYRPPRPASESVTGQAA